MALEVSESEMEKLPNI